MGKKSIAKNYIYNLIYQLLSIISPLITAPYLSHILGAKNLGIHGYSLSIVTYFILLGSLGVSLYGQREIAYVQDDKEKRSNVFFELVLIRFVTYFFSLILYYYFFCRTGDYSIYYRILVIEMLANLIDISWYFQGTEEFKKTVVRNLLVKILGLVFIFTCIKTKSDLRKYFFLYVIFDFIGNASLWLYLKNEVKLNLSQLKFKRHIKPVLLLFLPQVAIRIYTVLDKTMVGNITGSMSEVGFYDQAQKLIRALLIIVTSLGLVMNSRIANSYANSDKKSIRKYMIQSVSTVWLISIPLMFGVMAISEKFIPWYLGDKFLPAIAILNASAPILVAIGLNNVTGIQYLIQVGKQNIFTISVIIGAFTNLVFNYILINKLGTVGAVYSSLISEFVILIYHLILIRKEIKISDFIKPGIKNIIAGIIMFLGVKTLTNHLSISIMNTVIEVLVGAVIYTIILILLKDNFFCDMIKNSFKTITKKMKVK